MAIVMSNMLDGHVFSIHILLAALIFLPVVYVFYQRLFHPLASIPGPFLASISRLWMIRRALDGSMSEAMIALHRKHGSLVRIGPNEISVSDLPAIKTIYGAGSKFNKSDFYSVFQGHRKFDLFAERDETIHGRQKRLVSRPYALESLKQLEPYVDDSIRVFLKHMQKLEDEEVDMGVWVNLFAIDVIGAVTFGRRFGFMDAGKDDGTLKTIQSQLKSGAWLGQIPALYWVNDFFMPCIGNHLDVNTRHGFIREFATREIDARIERGSDHKDILSQLKTTHELKPDDFDRAALISMAATNINAGSDTTAVTLRAIIYYLLKNPSCKQRLQEEIDSLRQQGKLSDPVTLKETVNMPYLQAVINEALRLHPAVGMNLPRVTPTGGTQIAGRYIPADSIVGVNAWVIHRDQTVFGEDPESFRPERWLKADTGDMNRFMFAFGSGARLCIGKNISMMEMLKLIPTLFVHYDLQLTKTESKWTTRCWLFVFQWGLNIRLWPRNADRS